MANHSEFDNFTQDSNGINYNLMFTYSYIAAIPIFIVGFIANCILLYLINTDKYFRKMTYHLIRIAIISDLISLTTSIIVFAIYASANIGYSLGSILCKLILFVTYSCYGVSLTSLCVVSIDRYYAVIKPLTSVYHYQLKRQIIYIGQTIGCLIALGVSVPITAYSNIHINETQFCDIPNMDRNITTYLLCLVFILYILPLSIITINYIKIIRFQYTYVRPGESSYRRCDNVQLKKKKFIRMLITITSIYLCVTWPFFAVLAGMGISLRSLKQIREMGLGYYLIAYTAFVTTFAINILQPFIYFRFDYNIKRVMKDRFGHFSC
ncbi:Neuropeptide SIFamide receptor [Trichoplax sp. H2]|nr:Neuropeptide SIFamide receptor [Trichoplax sp. H2]|eukprot:RDD38417.1 Neuropeptide SIFamide receptor [Trichoplax sp. H2]